MLHSDDIRARTIEIKVSPGPQGNLYEIAVFESGNRNKFIWRCAPSIPDVIGHVVNSLTDFYVANGELKFEHEIDSSTDVAREMCGQCEETAICARHKE
jgi:hypothetical protein